MGKRRMAVRAGVAGAVLLALAAGASAGLVALHHGGRTLPVSVMVVTAAPSPSEPATADFPAPAPTASPTATPTPTAAPTARPTPASTPQPASSSLPHCDPSYFMNPLTLTRRPDGSVLIDYHIHEQWHEPPCAVPHDCKLGYTVYNRMGGPIAGTDQPVHCKTWARYTGDLDVSALWSTCHTSGDYQVNVTYGQFEGIAYYTASQAEPKGCPGG